MCERYVGVLCKSLNNNLDESAKQNNNKNFQKGTPCEVIDKLKDLTNLQLKFIEMMFNDC